MTANHRFSLLETGLGTGRLYLVPSHPKVQATAAKVPILVRHYGEMVGLPVPAFVYQGTAAAAHPTRHISSDSLCRTPAMRSRMLRTRLDTLFVCGLVARICCILR